MKKLGIFLSLLFAITIYAQEAKTESTEVETSQAEIDALLNAVETTDTPLKESVTFDSTTNSKKFNDYGIYGSPLVDCSNRDDELNIWSALFKGFIGGLAALFFPCTFPMIPMTMSFFLKGSGDVKKGKKNAIFYGFCIMLVYFICSLPFNFGLGAAALNNLSTNIWVNLTFFVVFVIFAFSLFGFYDISMPSSIANKLDSKSNTGNILGIFFMAFTLVIVSFSCTGPILGLVLGNLNNVKYVTPAFTAFGLGLGLPFAIFAMFPELVKNLPKSGSWLDVVKNVFGFVELAFALKFLSNADLVMQWGILKREPFVIIWMIVFVLLGFYLIGKFSFKKGTTIKKTPITLTLAIISFLFVGYLGTDFFGGKLGLISGFPPPKDYSIFPVKEDLNTNKNDYDKAMALAKAEGKPLLIDFTGQACVNCRKMEENVWTDPLVHDMMKNNFVITSLFVDQDTKLPESEHRYSEALSEDYNTIGDKWKEIQYINLHEQTQPQYVIIDSKTERIINKPMSGLNSVEDFKAFLECGLSYKP